MSVRLLCFVVLLLVSVSPSAARAQTPPQHQHPPGHAPEVQAPKDAAPPHDMQHDTMAKTEPLGISIARDGSGTSWLPDITPMFAIHGQAGSWGWMLHESFFLQYVNEGGARGDDQFGSTNWVMGMAHRDVAGGPLTLRGMVSVEPLTVGECGYPALLATGESCDGEPLHDRQHPHDLFMELAAEYKRAINDGLAYQLYAAVAGEPALGPAAFPHRLSAFGNPLAPISHHWLDSTHISFGVLSAGLYQQRWKAEASLFNGREPDEHRYNFDFGALDSFSGRFWLLPSAAWALQFSAAHLNEAEAEHDGGPRRDVDRMTASLTYHRPSPAQRFWATTVAWGQNREEGVTANALLGESSVAVTERDSLFGRGEITQKTAHDLVLDEHDDDLFTVGKLQAGYVRSLGQWSSFVPGVGASVSFSFVPERLSDVYGGRVAAGFALFFSLRPAAMMMGGGGHQHP